MKPATRDISVPKLLFVTNVLWFFISHRLPVAMAARRAGYSVHVAADEVTSEDAARLSAAGIEVHPIDVRRSSRNLLSNLRLFWQLLRLYRSLAPDVVHHVTIKPVMLGTLAARLTRVPVAVNAVSGMGYAFTPSAASRSGLRRLLKIGYQLCLRHPQMRMIFQNPHDRDEFLRWAGVAMAQTVLIPGSGVDLAQFSATPEPALPVRVLLPARLLFDKGVEEFARACAEVRARGVQFEALLAGALDPGNPAAMREDEVRALERSTGVRWIGHVQDMSALIRSVHIVCLPSYREGLPKVLIEAAASGRPIVTTDVPGCRDVVDEGVEGFLVPVRAIAPLADAIARLACDGALRRQMGAAARARAERSFGVDGVIERTLRVYSDARRR